MKENISAQQFIAESKDNIIVDVRTPLEYENGHIIGAFNIPLFSNEERAVVGTIYKKVNKEKAVEKGLEFVGVRMADMVKSARKLLKKKGCSKIYIYCWRGGMRSNSVAWLFQTAGMDVEVLKGGYKAYRGSFIELLKQEAWKLIVVGGPTGCGKTTLLNALIEKGEQVVDLEGIANHMGSAFGKCRIKEPQPTSEHFANLLYDELLKFDKNRYIWCEGESLSIGRVFMPQEFFLIMQKSPFIYYEIPREDRLDNIMLDYGQCSKEFLIECFDRIKKRLGFDNAKNAIELVENGDIRGAADIAMKYYDKGYAKSIGDKEKTAIAKVEMESSDIALAVAKVIEIKIKNNL
ncbi:MAG: tRNA 2-selenouridine(34) synthase MnmH [Bacteroidetes bacterium]|nr:tRNA 2-selenouridine(34) synthase MnmH [Bacteroidota bacterium]